MRTASDQVELLPARPPELRRERIAHELLDGFRDAKPNAKLRELVCELGLLRPIVLASGGSGRYQVIDGRRRAKAIPLLASDGQWPAPAQVDALVIAGDDTPRQEARGGLALALHASRSPSPASELQAIETIIVAGGADREIATVKADRGPDRPQRPGRLPPTQAPLADRRAARSVRPKVGSLPASRSPLRGYPKCSSRRSCATSTSRRD